MKLGDTCHLEMLFPYDDLISRQETSRKESSLGVKSVISRPENDNSV